MCYFSSLLVLCISSDIERVHVAGYWIDPGCGAEIDHVDTAMKQAFELAHDTDALFPYPSGIAQLDNDGKRLFRLLVQSPDDNDERSAGRSAVSKKINSYSISLSC